jgi:predicted DNA-binding protein (MmcQ/YjbR family)
VTKKAKNLRDKLLASAIEYPGAHIDHPWGETVVKVNKKVFVFLGMDDDPKGMSVKLPDSNEQALALEGAEPTGYGLGRAGWVSLSFDGKDVPPIGVLRDWLDESYRTVAPKKLIAELDARTR